MKSCECTDVAEIPYDSSWKDSIPVKRFKIYETVSGVGSEGRWTGMGEVIFSYPVFESLQEGLDWIHTVLDPYYTGKYGIVCAD